MRTRRRFSAEFKPEVSLEPWPPDGRGVGDQVRLDRRKAMIAGPRLLIVHQCELASISRFFTQSRNCIG
jgi:hypothetical protein